MSILILLTLAIFQISIDFSWKKLHYYPIAIKCIWICNALNDSPNQVCIPNETEGLNIHVFNMIAGKNESKMLTKNTSSKCKCKFYGRKCSSYQKWNSSNCWCKC